MLDRPVRAGVRHGGPIDVDVVFIVESEELLFGELRAIVRDNGVRDSKAMDDVEEEQHSLLRLDRGDRPSLYPLCKLDKQVGIAPGRSFERSDQIEPPDHEWPCDGDYLECFGRQVGLPSVVLTPFIGAHYRFSVGYCGRPVEALSECVSDQGPRCGMVPTDPTMDISQQLLSLFDRDAALQDPSVASLMRALNSDKGLGATCEPLSLCFVHR